MLFTELSIGVPEKPSSQNDPGEQIIDPPKTSITTRLRNLTLRQKFAAIMVVGILLISSYIAIYSYARSLLGETEIELERITILESDEDSLQLEIEVLVHNPSSFSQDLKSTTLDIMYLEEKVAVLVIPSLTVESGDVHLSFVSELREARPYALDHLASNLFSSETVELGVKGTLETDGLFSLELPLEKTIILDDIQEPELTLDNIIVPNSDENGIDVELNVDILNRGILETTLEGLAFGVRYNDSTLTTIHTSGFLGSGSTNLNLSFRIPSESEETARILIRDLLQGNPASFGIQGINGTSLLSRLSSQFDFTYLYTDSDTGLLSDLTMEVLELSIENSDASGINGAAHILISNPSRVGMTLDGLLLEVLYDNHTLLTIPTTGFLETGETILHYPFLIPAEVSETANELISTILEGRNTSFVIRGISSRNMLSRLSTEFSYNDSMDVPGNFNASVSSFAINSIGLFQSRVDVKVSVNNPTPIKANLETMEFTAYYHERYLGDLVFENPLMIPGEQIVELSLYLQTLSFQNLQLLGDLVSGNGVELEVEGKRVFNPDHTLRFLLTVEL